MSLDDTTNGVAVSEEQISEWVVEAEANPNIEALKVRGRGRPGRGAKPSQVVALRLTIDELASIDAVAEREHKTRSELIREALAKYAA
ncbi:ribbon-helix-helix protein, CopG family [Nakamurella antarctica]|uniref:Ribbon-helix-helix protein, CopG family n=1 Tax=Nakamurella antarctica TaxID=1902245 RepID=A0A3G8ZJI8_9ACTN|nr:ribbon-helix-helix protein, CopG family [Nakamurella antarctica]AZI57519.1 ribbon-helix-helix protein, CopG family [Nakamurella antarctica]